MRGAGVDVGVEARRDRTHERPSAVGDPESLPIALDQSILIRLEQIGQEPLDEGGADWHLLRPVVTDLYALAMFCRNLTLLRDFVQKAPLPGHNTMQAR